MVSQSRWVERCAVTVATNLACFIQAGSIDCGAHLGRLNVLFVTRDEANDILLTGDILEVVAIRYCENTVKIVYIL